MALPGNAAAESTGKNIVKGITYKNNRVTVYVKPAVKNKRPQYKYNTLSDGRFYIDFLNSAVEKSLNFKAKKGNVSKITRNQFNRSTSRVVLQLKNKKIKPTVKYYSSPPRFVINVGAASKSSGQKQFRILIDPGHGGWDPGAIGRNGTKEKQVTLDIAKQLEQYLRGRDNVVVIMTRRSDKYVSLSARKRMAQSWKADLFVSIHANGSSFTHLNQTEIYYHDRKSYALAKMIRKELVRELRQRDGGVRKKSLAVIRRNPAKYGSVLVESDYLTNKAGEQRLRSDNYKQKIARSIYESIDSFLNTKQ